MTTDEAIKELRENVSNYPVAGIQVWPTFITVIFLNGDSKEFKSGIEMLEWLEKTFRDENGNLKGEAENLE